MALVLLALPLALLGLAVALWRRVGITVGINEHSEVVGIARHTRGWRLVGLLVGGVAAVAVLALGERVDSLGRVTALAPTVLGAGVLLGTIAGELTARPPVGIHRSAAVETRTVGAILPRGRALVLAVSTVLLLGALAVGVAWGSADDLGRLGRVVSRACTVVEPDLGAVRLTSSRGPWPGSFYALPLLGALAVLAVLVVVALRVIVARPRPDVGSLGLDTQLRRWSAGNVISAASVTVLGTLGPVAVFMASALGDQACPRGAAQTLVAWSATVVGPLAIGAATGLLVGLVVTPSIRVDDLPRPLPGDAAPVGAPVR